MSWKLLIILVIIFDAAVWWQVVVIDKGSDFSLYFLNVGQGDSELINFDGIQILIDGGPGAQSLESLSQILPANDRYLDLVILTHPHLDHFGGLIDVFKNYRVGLFIDSGFGHQTAQYDFFEKELREKKIRRVALREKDRIKYKDLVLQIISPSVDAGPVKAKNIHNNTIIFMLKKEGLQGLFTGDTNFKSEGRLEKKYGTSLAANLLKVSHHGSNKSTSQAFLSLVKPQIAVIGVGKNNRYGHPKKELLDRLKNAGAKTYRTDLNGIIKAYLENEKLKLSVQR